MYTNLRQMLDSGQVSVYAGGPGSGCHGDNCGRPEGSGSGDNVEDQKKAMMDQYKKDLAKHQSILKEHRDKVPQFDKSSGEVKVGDTSIGKIKQTSSEVYESRPGQKHADTKKTVTRYSARSSVNPSYPTTYFDSKKKAIAHLVTLYERASKT